MDVYGAMVLLEPAQEPFGFVSWSYGPVVPSLRLATQLLREESSAQAMARWNFPLDFLVYQNSVMT